MCLVNILALLLRDAQLFVESFGLGFATKELFENVHFLLGTTTLKNRMSVTTAFGGVHGVRLEDSVEHVCRVDLRREIAVVTVMVSV
jgi:hypothetical protein